MAKLSALVVDDEFVILNFVTTVLERYNYRVTAARSAQRALDLCRAGQHTFDFLLSDVIMPSMNGPELARQLRDLNIAIPILFMTGHPSMSREENQFQAPVIHKPFTPVDLISAIQQVLFCSSNNRQ